MQIKAVHQFHPSCSSGDGVTNAMLFSRNLLRELGFKSEIYCDVIPEDMRNEARPFAELQQQQGLLLLVHHSLGYDHAAWLNTMPIPKVLVYHNITPEHLLPKHGELRRLSVLGRAQLAQWAHLCIGAIGVSDFNSQELQSASYKNIATIPLLVDIELVRHAPLDQSITESLRNSINLLFVGRINDNKRQDKLLEVLHEYLHFANQPVRLILAGGTTNDAYRKHIEARIKELGIDEHVWLTGKVPDATLMALYSNADAFICMSEHEGFGMPLIEAMLFDVPVIAHATSSIPTTLGEGGLLLENDDPREMAALLHMVLTEPTVRRRVIAGQRRNLLRFSRNSLRKQLADYLTQLGVEVPNQPATTTAAQPSQWWLVDGPFDSSYSLAIVNRELGRALSMRGQDIGLRNWNSTDSNPPSKAFLTADPQSARLAQRAEHASEPPEVVLRYCYPPHVDDMPGLIRAIHSYGWEETGFPTEYVNAFNRKLDLITVASRFVAKILRDNGVRVPIAVAGTGVDHLLCLSATRPSIALRGFNFLHVSSCFPRKGVDALLAAYGAAFRRHDDVSLVIKSFPNPHNNVAEQLGEWQRNDPDFPDVVLINRDMDQSEMVGLYQVCQAFVAPTRGEGFGMPLAEAMLFNLPVIATAWSGQLDFCDDSTAWLCDFRFARAQTHLGLAHSAWADPDVVHLSTLMREVCQASPQQRAVRTNAARQRILNDFTWDRLAQRTEQIIDALKQQPLLRKEPHIGWVSTWNTRCGIATYSAFLSENFPSDRVTILANRTSDLIGTDETNVVRCWNMHHNETLNDAFNSIIAHGINAIVIQYNFGFFTLSTLADFISRLKQAGIAVHCFFHATSDAVQNGNRVSLADIALTLAQADRLYVHGIQDLNRLKGFGLIDNVVLFPHGVLPSLPSLVENERKPLDLREKKVIASYGFLLPHKGIQTLIRAFARLAENDQDFHLLLVNALYPAVISVQERDACELLISESGLSDRIQLITDFLPDAQSLAHLRSADLIVYPYEQTEESVSGAVRIGIASGQPVAVTPLKIFDDVAEAVHQLPGTDVDQIADGIAHLLKHPGVLAKQAAKTSRWIASREWSLLSTRLLNIIDGMANQLP